jgi:hypothetical protein
MRVHIEIAGTTFLLTHEKFAQLIDLLDGSELLAKNHNKNHSTGKYDVITFVAPVQQPMHELYMRVGVVPETEYQAMKSLGIQMLDKD